MPNWSIFAGSCMQSQLICTLQENFTSSEKLSTCKKNFKTCKMNVILQAKKLPCKKYHSFLQEILLHSYLARKFSCNIMLILQGSCDFLVRLAHILQDGFTWVEINFLYIFM